MNGERPRRSESRRHASTLGLVERLIVVAEVVQEVDVPVAIAAVRAELRSWALDPVDLAAISTIISELGSNIVKYGDRGELHVFVDFDEQDIPRRVTIVADDKGPGIDDVDLALREQYSTGGSLGLGLSGVVHLSDRLDIESRPALGLRVQATRRLRYGHEH